MISQLIRNFSTVLLLIYRPISALAVYLIKFLFWRKSRTYYCLLSIFLLGVFLRLVGTYPGYPFTNPDEPTIADGVRRIILYHNFKPGNYYYGSLLSIIYSVIDLIFFIPILFISQFIANLQNVFKYGLINFFHDFYASLQIQSYISYWARYETAVLSAFTILVMYLLGKKLFNKRVGLVTASLTAVNYRHVASSRFSLADAPAALFAGLAILFIINIIQRSTLKNYLLSGVAVGLAFSVKYFVYVLPAFLLAHLYIVLKQKHFLFNKKFIFSFLTIIVVFLAINPYLLFDFKEASWQLTLNAKRYGLANPYSSFLVFINGNQAYFTLVPIRYLLWYGLGWTLTFSIIAGYLYALVQYFKKTIFLSAIIFPFLFVFLILSKHAAFVRNYASITPFLLLFPSILITDLSKLTKNRNVSFAIIAVLIFVVGFTSFKDSLLSSLYFANEHNLVSAETWINKNLVNKPSINVAVTGDFPNIYKIDIAKTILITSRGAVENMTIGELVGKNIDWAILGSSATALKNAELWSGNKTLTIEFFNKDKMTAFLKNSYTGLALLELGDYRVAEFVKPFWQSNEASYFIVKVPRFLKGNKKILREYNFGLESVKDFMLSSFLPCNFYQIIKTKDEEFPSIKIIGNQQFDRLENCVLETQFTWSQSFDVKENKWYGVEGQLKRKGNPKLIDTTNGFIRLDFYSAENKIIKTNVSPQLKNINDWQTIYVLGIAPIGSKYAKIGFQLDQYFDKEEYLINSFKIYAYDKTGIDFSQYPYYGKPIPENFYWLLEL